MTAYAFGKLTVRHTDWIDEYTRRIGPLFKQYGAEVVAKGPATVLEGDNKAPDIAICIAFPSEEAAKNWYHDSETQALVKLRQSGSDFELILVGK